MADGKISVEICAPERPTVCVEAEEVLCPGEEGVFTVRPAHTAFLSTLCAGVVVAVVDGAEQFFSVNGGFAEVCEDRVKILTETFEDSDHIDLKRAESAQERAEKRLAKPGEDTDVLRAEMALYRAVARIQASKRVSF